MSQPTENNKFGLDYIIQYLWVSYRKLHNMSGDLVLISIEVQFSEIGNRVENGFLGLMVYYLLWILIAESEYTVFCRYR